MESGDPKPRSPAGVIIERSIPSWDKMRRTLGESPSGIAQRQSRLEATQLELRALFPSRTLNTLFNPVKGGDEGRFFFGLVGSLTSCRNFLFGDREVSILSPAEPAYIEPPHIVNGNRLRPLVAQYFVYGEISPKTMAEDPRISPEIHEEYLIEFAQEGKPPKYLFPAEPGILKILPTINVAPTLVLGGLSIMELYQAYLPKNLDEAREFLLKGTTTGAALDVIKIHDTLETVTTRLFSGEERKTNVPYSILQVAGGIKYNLYPYGKNPPAGPIPDGCALLAFQWANPPHTAYFLIVPETTLPSIISRGLPSQNDEGRVG